MGNTSNYLIIMLCINLVMGIVALGIASVNPDSPYLASNYLFNINENALANETQTSNGVRYYNFTYSSTGLSTLAGSQSTVSTDTFKVPDWTRSANNWANEGFTGSVTGAAKMLINFVGAPYTFLTKANVDSDLAALIGAFWAILSTFVLANWLFGRDT